MNFTWLVIAQASDSSSSLCRASDFEGVNSSSQLCIICKLAHYLFQSCVQVIYEDVEELRAKDGALWSPDSVTGHHSDVAPFTVTLCASPMSQLLTQHTMMCLSSFAGHFVQWNPVRYSIKICIEIKKDDIKWLPLIS
ncbi:hypothetical protein TURU_162276 [Turdus rufiventris]|nr:hypothetical protein TURU_162276 [Turdus rufiventris]